MEVLGPKVPLWCLPQEVRRNVVALVAKDQAVMEVLGPKVPLWCLPHEVRRRNVVALVIHQLFLK